MKVLIKTSIIGKVNKQGFTLVEILLVIVLIGVVLVLAVPSTRDVLTGDNLKKASRQFIAMERKLRVEAVRDQINYILCIDLPNSAYWVITSDMTPEKQDEIKKTSACICLQMSLSWTLWTKIIKKHQLGRQELISEKTISVLPP